MMNTCVVLCFFPHSYEVNEMTGVLSLVVYRDAGTYGNVSVFFYAQNLEAQLSLDFNATASVSDKYKFVSYHLLCVL